MLTKADIDWLESEYLQKLADKVKTELAGKLDDISKKLDTFIGEIKSKREEQTLHQGQHEELDERMKKIEKGYSGSSPIS